MDKMKRLAIAVCAATLSSNFAGYGSLSAKASTFKLLHSFCSELSCTDGAAPYSPRLLMFHGKLYGTTYLGGDNAASGTIFTIDPKTGYQKVVHSFDETDPDNGANPIAGLVNVDGTLYGTTRDGGLYESGTVFSFDPERLSARVLYSFNSQFGRDAYFPRSDLIKAKGLLYGTTEAGGYDFDGAIFSFDLITGVENVVYSFTGSADGGRPGSGFIKLNHMLYSTTLNGGTHAGGTVFVLDPKTGSETVMHSFSERADDGRSPKAGLISIEGTLYGTTSEYGKHNAGTVFSLDPASGAEKTLYAFCKRKNCTDGASPQADLLFMKGQLYGTTANGGRYGWGTVFALELSTGVETVIHSFNGADGAMPLAPLTSVNGTLFGTTQRGGAHEGGVCFQYGCGTVFSVIP